MSSNVVTRIFITWIISFNLFIS